MEKFDNKYGIDIIGQFTTKTLPTYDNLLWKGIEESKAYIIEKYATNREQSRIYSSGSMNGTIIGSSCIFSQGLPQIDSQGCVCCTIL